jgi:glutamate racemase
MRMSWVRIPPPPPNLDGLNGSSFFMDMRGKNLRRRIENVNRDSRAPIGVFDSGVGGLTVLKALREQLPGEDFIYLGDTARLPYGRKPPEMVREFAWQISSFLINQGVKFLVIACNTASSCALPGLSSELEVPVLGVIEPGVAAARAINHGGQVGVVATKGTINAKAYQSRLEKAGLRVWSQSCPMFVPLVEEGLADSIEARLMVKHYLKDRPNDLEVLILGCTHYPMLKPVIAAELGDSVVIVDSASVTASETALELSQMQLLNPRTSGGEVIHYVTGDPQSYQHTASVIGGVSGEIRLLEIEKLLEMSLHHAN